MTQVCDLCNGFGYTVTITDENGQVPDEKQEVCEDCFGKGKIE